MSAASLLIMIHCEQHTGYAVGVLEKVFADAATFAGYRPEQIFWSYSKVYDDSAGNVIACHYQDQSEHQSLAEFVRRHNIRLVLAFDLGYPAKVIEVLRKAGVARIVSYWGASMSSINSGLKLAIKRLDWHLRTYKPDHFIFESEAMRLTATSGRGVPYSRTSVVALGVDTEVFFPAYGNYFYAHEELNIPRHKKIVFYSGHMEERKGVRVIMQAAVAIFEQQPELPIHFVICGNKPGEELRYLEVVRGTAAEAAVTFAGYRTDIAGLMRSSFMGVIASTGWDSFTMSSVEMMASGLPMVVSNLQGLGETIEMGVNGWLIPPGDYRALLGHIIALVNDQLLACEYSKNSRARAESKFSRKVQVQSLALCLKN